jgi:phage-related protein
VSDDLSQKKIPAGFYQTKRTGRVPVRDWMREFSFDDRKEISKSIALVEYGWPVGMPICEDFGKGLWQVRCRVSRGRIACVFFCFADGCMILLHGFIKKTAKTPFADLDLALQRMKEVQL